MRKEQTPLACENIIMDRGRPGWIRMKYTTYFYSPSHSARQAAFCFADPTLEFSTLEEARTFAQAAAGATQFGTGSFRIASGDCQINEYWIRDGDDWKLTP
jgi:hypothetical protein